MASSTAAASAEAESNVGLRQVPAKLADLQIAGIAAAYGLQLATRNIRDFQGVGLAVIDPWTA